MISHPAKITSRLRRRVSRRNLRLSIHRFPQVAHRTVRANQTRQSDIVITGGNVVAGNDLTIAAAGDLTVQSAQDTRNNANTFNNRAIGTVVVSDTERFTGYHTEDHADGNA